MSNRTLTMLILSIFLWASAFVGIRIGLHSYSPGALALLRYLVASSCMTVAYFLLPKRSTITFRDKISMLLAGAIGIGFYNLTLNHGEIAIASGMACFIISMSPIIASLLAVLFLGERLGINHLFGLVISIIGVLFISLGEGQDFGWHQGLVYILLATISGSCYTIMQKPLVSKYHAIEVTTYAIWGGALSLLFYFPALMHEIHSASSISTWTVVYLGIFPAAFGYLAWSYVLTQISASRAVSYLYFQPFIVTMLGWVALNEVPSLMALCGGTVTMLGVWIVNRRKKIIATVTAPEMKLSSSINA